VKEKQQCLCGASYVGYFFLLDVLVYKVKNCGLVHDYLAFDKVDVHAQYLDINQIG